MECAALFSDKEKELDRGLQAFQPEDQMADNT